MEGYTVMRIPKEQTYEWLLKKHYAKRIPPVITDSFGLYSEMVLKGCMTFGLSGNINNNSLGKYPMKELTRLVLIDNQPNAASFFISRCFKELEKPVCLISYSDLNQNHHGYIYQSTNWIYTGLSSEEPIYILSDKP